MTKLYEKLNISFPTEDSTPLTTLKGFSQLWYGREKVGKTTLAQQFPAPLFLMFEPGGKALAMRQAAVRTWAQFKAWVQLLEDKREEYETVVVDTVDIAYRRCSEWICKRAGIEHPHDADDFGATYSAIDREFYALCERLANCGRGVIFISHTTEIKLKRASGAEQSRLVPSLNRRGREVLEPMVDIWAYYEYNALGERVLHVRGDDLVSAGNRCKGHFRETGEIPMGDSAREAYKNFTAAFENRLAEQLKRRKKSVK